jgi:hypothetical protein
MQAYQVDAKENRKKLKRIQKAISLLTEAMNTGDHIGNTQLDQAIQNCRSVEDKVEFILPVK